VPGRAAVNAILDGRLGCAQGLRNLLDSLLVCPYTFHLTLLFMDTISRESNNSYLPVAGVLVGVVALILGIAALAKVSSLSKKVPDDLQDRLTSVESNATSAAAAADKASKGVDSLQRSTQSAFDSIGPELVSLKDSVQKMEEAAKARAVAPKGAKGGDGAAGSAAAGPGEYKVKPGDTGSKIARATGVGLSQLETLNPGVDWRRLKVGQTVKTK
jgi:LysM repeat protein